MYRSGSGKFLVTANNKTSEKFLWKTEMQKIRYEIQKTLTQIIGKQFILKFVSSFKKVDALYPALKFWLDPDPASICRMRSSLVVRASDCKCTSCNGPGFDPSIRRHSGIWGAADEAVLNMLWQKIKKSPPPQKKKSTYQMVTHIVGRGQNWETSQWTVERSEPWELSPASSTPTYQMMTHVVGTEVGGQPQDCWEVRTLGNEAGLAEIASKILLHIQVQIVCIRNFSA